MVGQVIIMDTTNLYPGLTWADWLLYIIIVYAIYYFSKLLFKKAFSSITGGDEE